LRGRESPDKTVRIRRWLRVFRRWSFFVSTGVFLFLLISAVLNSLRIQYYPLIRRVTFQKQIEISLTGSLDLDFLLIALSATLMGGLFFVEALISGIRPAFTQLVQVRKLLTSVFLVIVPIQMVSLAIWLYYPFSPGILVNDSISRWVHLEAQTFLSTTPLLNAATLSFLGVGATLSLLGLRHKDIVDETGTAGKQGNRRESWSSRGSVTIIGFSVGLSVLFAVYPYLPGVNPSGGAVSVDVRWYNAWVNEMLSESNWIDALKRGFYIGDGDRPLFLLLLFAIAQVTRLPVLTIAEFIPVLLGPISVLSIYYAVRISVGETRFAVLAGLFTVVSSQFTVSMYAGFFANWLAISGSYLFLALMSRFLEAPSRKLMISSMILSLMVLLTHNFTWTLVTVVAALLLLTYIPQGRDSRLFWRTRFLPYAMVILVSLTVDLAKTWLIGLPGGIVNDYVIASSHIGIEQLLRRWLNLSVTITTYVGGMFANPVMLGLAFGGLFAVRYSNGFERAMLIWLLVGFVPVLFGTTLVQTRLLYNLPVHVLAALFVSRFHTAYLAKSGLKAYSLLLGSSAILALLNYVLRNMVNLVP